MQYLVHGQGGPGFTSPEETLQVLEEGILPTFDYLIGLEKDRNILAGGTPVGERAIAFVVEASSNDEVDRLIRDIPAWAALDWQVTPLQTFAGRAAMERAVIAQLRPSV
jgi:hypothetical protein